MMIAPAPPNDDAPADLALVGGRLFDPGSGVDARQTLLIADGRVAGLPANRPAVARREIDVNGLVVVPGLVDLHVHVYEGVSHYGIDVDSSCLHRGVTTAVDAGSAGAQTFPGFQKFVVSSSRTRLYAFLNVSTCGMLVPEMGELEDARLLVPDKAVAVAAAYPESIVGIKIRIGPWMTDSVPERALATAKAVANEVKLPLMVHITNTELPLDGVLAVLGEGDIVTHCFHGKRGGILDNDHHVLPEVKDAVDSGVRLDVGHGRSGFSFEVARRALAEGVGPHHISSDLHAYNVDGPVYDLTTTMSKMLHVGFSLEDTIRTVTTAPATAIGRDGEVGSLEVGQRADVTVLERLEGRWELEDGVGKHETLEELLVPRWVIRNGEPLELPTSVHER